MNLEPQINRCGQRLEPSADRALQWVIEAAVAHLRGEQSRFERAASAFSPEDRDRLETALPRYFRRPQEGELTERGVGDSALILSPAFAKFLEKWASSFSRTCALSGTGMSERAPSADTP